jgi:hypothetical protein
VNAKDRLRKIVEQISADPKCDALWKQAGLEAVNVVRECVEWHTQRGRDPRQVTKKMLRVIDAIVDSPRRGNATTA